jgi:uncharacterized membrane protein YhaH (DUF805 family)
MKWFLKAFKQYADFKGRARRTEYWMFALFALIFLFAGAILDNLLGLTMSPEMPYGVFYSLIALALLVPSLAVAVRRLHDVGKSGWWYFIGFIPLVGAILLLVWFCTDSQSGENKWGANPKEIA